MSISNDEMGISLKNPQNPKKISNMCLNDVLKLPIWMVLEENIKILMTSMKHDI